MKDTIEQKPVAVARCQFCTWVCEFSGYDADEAALFLHARLVEHVERIHPERLKNAGRILTQFTIGGPGKETTS